MRVYQAYLEQPKSPTASMRAISPATGSQEKTVLGNIVRLKWANGYAVPIYFDRPCLILASGVENILLGYYEPSDKTTRIPQTVVDGDMFLTCGKTRGLRTSEDGTIELVNMFTKETGEIVINPIASYTKDNELNIKLEKLIVDMYGANSGGNIAWTQDKATGFNTFITNYKGSNKDMGPRVYQKIEGTASGTTIQFIADVSPTPVNPNVPSLMDLLPQSIHLDIGGGDPFRLALMLATAAQLEISFSAQGDLLINTISGAQIGIAKTGEVSIKSTGGLGTITMSPAGAVEVKATTTIHIDATAGLQIKGKGQELLTELGTFIQQYVAHTHPTGVGPSGPPVLADTTSSGPLANVNLMKG